MNHLLPIAIALLLGAQPEKIPAPTNPLPVPAAPAAEPQPSPSDAAPAQAPSPPANPLAPFAARLEALSPDKPLEYFLLGEEIAAETSPADKDLTLRNVARQLFVLSYQFAEQGAPGRVQLGPSACLALASIASRDDERRWLRALADTLADRPPALGAPPREAQEAYPLDTALDLATAMGLARAGEGRRAEQLLEKPGVADLLDRIDVLPMPDGGMNGLKNVMRRAIRDWPVCPQCRNRRVVPVGANRAGEVALCDTCRGNPGPRLTEEEISSQLRIETFLLQGVQRSWASQALSDGGAPLRDLDPAELVGTYHVDPGRPYWRRGAWTDTPSTAP